MSDITSFVSQVKLAEFSKTPEDFLKKYEELKSKNVRNLDPLVYLLSKLCEDKEVTHRICCAEVQVSAFLQNDISLGGESGHFKANPPSNMTSFFLSEYVVFLKDPLYLKMWFWCF